MDDRSEIIWTADNDRVLITPDDYPDSPRDNDNLGTIATLDRRDRIGDTTWLAEAATNLFDRYSTEEVIELLKEEHGATCVIPLREYHTGVGVTLVPAANNERPVAVTFDDAKTREAFGTPLERVRDNLMAELDEYNKFAIGDVWIVSLERRVTWQRQDDPSITKSEWELIDSICGFIGHDYAVEAAKDEYPQPVTA
jgi:hypothetical protein